MLIRTASVRWSTPLWRVTQKSSASCWARTGEQRCPVTHSSITAMRAWLGKRRQFSRLLQLLLVLDTHRYELAEVLMKKKCLYLADTIYRRAGWESLFSVELVDVLRCLQRLEVHKWFGFHLCTEPVMPSIVKWFCFFVQVVKSLLDFKDEQLSVQMDAHDTLWGETGTFLLFHSDEFSFCKGYTYIYIKAIRLYNVYC